MAPALPTRTDVLVVGAGYAGAVMAERIATELGLDVLVIDRRDHIAGNAFDERDEHGILVHRYGPHLFHTQHDPIFAYLSRFTDWSPYEHRVLAHVRDRLVPLPINRRTLELLYDVELTPGAEVEAFLAARAEPREAVHTSEDVVVAKVGRELYELFFRGYTRKLWRHDPSELAASVAGRIPTRSDDEDRYFTDQHQALPAEGYTAMFGRLLDHPRITVATGVEADDARTRVAYRHLVWTGPIDEFYGHRFGALPYRSLRFERSVVATPGGAFHQPVAQVNHPDEATPFLRITEYRHLYRQVLDRSTIVHEFPSETGDPYYPVPRPENRDRYHRYERLAADDDTVTFVGRLARYQYLNMDQVVGQALATFDRRRPLLAALRDG